MFTVIFVGKIILKEFSFLFLLKFSRLYIDVDIEFLILRGSPGSMYSWQYHPLIVYFETNRCILLKTERIIYSFFPVNSIRSASPAIQYNSR